MTDSTIIHFEIPANEPDKLAHFYSRLFCWKITKLQGDEEYWYIETQPEFEKGLSGGISSKESLVKSPVNFFRVDSLDDALKKVERLGGSIQISPQNVPDGIWAIVKDPEGNRFALFRDIRPG